MHGMSQIVDDVASDQNPRYTRIRSEGGNPQETRQQHIVVACGGGSAWKTRMAPNGKQHLKRQPVKRLEASTIIRNAQQQDGGYHLCFFS